MMKERGFRPVLPEVFRLFDRLFDRCRGASAAPCGAGENEKAGGRYLDAARPPAPVRAQSSPF